MRKLLSILALLLSFMSPGLIPAAAAAVPEDDTRALQEVVRAQLAAFAADDAERAFSFASQSIQTLFGTPAQFLRMVRSTYPVVYRPASVMFLHPIPDAAVVVQPVRMTDGNGAAWVAVYRLERQPDKSWRIAGCTLLPQSGQVI